MFDLDRWQEIWATISRNKMRSFLTAMGVFWGIFMLVVMAGAGLGLERFMLKQVGSFATNSCFMFTDNTAVPYKGFRSGRYWDFSNSDLGVIRSNVAGVDVVSGVIFGRSVNISRGDKKGTFRLIGHMPEYQKIEPQGMSYGRYINDIDMDNRRKVCSIGSQVYKELFTPGEDPQGQILQINSSYFTVVGVSESLSNISIGGNSREMVIIPFSTMQQMYNRGDKFAMLAVTGVDEVDVRDLEQSIKDVVRSRHNISPDDAKAIGGFNLKEQFDMFSNLFFGIRLLTWIVGLGTLFAGVVGVSNIMLVVIRERTQEIGVRRALGAPPVAIISQIISESFVLTFVAGVAGIALGVSVLSVADSIIAAQTTEGVPISAQISFGAAMTAGSVLVLGGLFAGVIPAYRAMKIKAVDAIREE